MATTLTASGNKLLLNGIATRLPGVSYFAGLKRHIDLNGDGWRVLVEPELDEIRRVADSAKYHGWIVLRVFRHASWWNVFGIVDPFSYSPQQAADFTSKCLAKGFLVDWTGGDYGICFPAGLDGMLGVHQHHNTFTSALVGLPYIWQVCNEPFQNGLDPFTAQPPPWVTVPWYSGNYNDARDPQCRSLHTDRGSEGPIPKWVGKAHESAPYMWAYDPRVIIYDEPMCAAEYTEANRRSNVPAYFRTFGTVLTLVNLAYYHFEAGMHCNGLGPEFAQQWPLQRMGMQEFFKGVVGALSPGEVPAPPSVLLVQ